MKPTKWDEIEAVVLVYYTAKTRYMNYNKISEVLIKYGKEEGRKITPEYRNLGGILLQTYNVRLYLNGNDKAHLSNVLKKVCDLYLKDDDKYYELLKIAKRRIDKTIEIPKKKKSSKPKKAKKNCFEKINFPKTVVTFLFDHKIKTIRKFISLYEKGTLMEIKGVGPKKKELFTKAYDKIKADKVTKASLEEKYSLSILSKSVEELNVNMNIKKTLLDNNINLIEDLLVLPISKLYMFKGLASKTITRIKKEIKLLTKYKNMYFEMFEQKASDAKMSKKELLLAKQKEIEKEIFKKGSIVYALKQECFKPKDMEEFEKEAENRKLTKEQFCLLITENQYSLIKDGLIDDEKILDYFEEHLTDDNKVYIPQTKDNEKIINYARSNGYEISELVNLYGYNYTDTDESEKLIAAKHKEILDKYIESDKTIYIDTNTNDYSIINTYAKNNNMTFTEYINKLGYQRINTKLIIDEDETDMESKDIKTDNECRKIMAKYPLIGGHIYDESHFKTIEQEAKNELDKKMSYQEYALTMDAKRKITIATVEYAKKWDSGKSKNFWNNIILQFGYKEEQTRARKIICDSVHAALKETGRFFFADTNGFQYKTTILIHAMSTSKSWNNLCEMLFEFFTNNLNYICMDNDPRIDVLVDVLKDKFNKYELVEENEDEVSDEVITIANKSFALQEGIRKLIVSRPKYTIKLFTKMFKYMSNYLHNEKEVTCYEELLCRNYLDRYIEKLSNKKNKELKDKLENKHRLYAGVTTEFTKIKPIYRYDDQVLSLLLPDVVIPKDKEFTRAYVQLFENRKLIKEYTLNYFGNKELGYTVQGLEINIEDAFAFRDNIRKLETKVKLFVDDTCVFDSGETLFREYLLFDKTLKEVDALNSFDDYFVVVGEGSTLAVEGENSRCEQVSSKKKLITYLLELKEQFVVGFNKRIIAIDGDSKNKKARLIMSEIKSDVSFIKGQDNYRVCTSIHDCKLFIDENEDLIQYIIKINGITVDKSKLFKVLSDPNNTFKLPLEDYINDSKIISIKVMNTKNNDLIVDEKIRLCDKLSYNFDRSFYFDSNDYEKGGFYCSCGGLKIKYRFNEKDEIIPIDYEDGTLEFKIPKITVIDNNNEIWNGRKRLWYQDVPSDLVLYVKTNSSINITDASIKIEDATIIKQGNKYDVGSAINMLSKLESSQRLILKIDGNEYVLANISTIEHFNNEVEIFYKDGNLYWDQGNGYVGSKNDVLVLYIRNKDEIIADDIILDLNENKINLDEHNLNDGEYSFEIFLKSKNVFIGEDTFVTGGRFSYGNVDLVRFNNTKISVVKITKLKQKGYNTISEKVPTLDMYIENIKYIGQEEEWNGKTYDDYPVYEGELHIIYPNDGDMTFYSILSDDKTSDKVKITYINEGIVEINTIEGDAYYIGKKFIYNALSNVPEKKYFITNDEEPNTGDLYFYEIRKDEEDV